MNYPCFQHAVYCRSEHWLHDDFTFYGPGGIGLARRREVYQNLATRMQNAIDRLALRRL